MSTLSVSSPRQVDAPVISVKGFEVSSSPIFTPGKVRKVSSLLSLELSSPTQEQPQGWSHTDSDDLEYSDYSDDDDSEEAGLPICIRDQAHYKLMLRARAVVNSRLYASAHPAQPQVQLQQPQRPVQ